jgi:hypothetical protein
LALSLLLFQPLLAFLCLLSCLLGIFSYVVMEKLLYKSLSLMTKKLLIYRYVRNLYSVLYLYCGEERS